MKRDVLCVSGRGPGGSLSSKRVIPVACSLETASFVAKGTQKRSFLCKQRNISPLKLLVEMAKCGCFLCCQGPGLAVAKRCSVSNKQMHSNENEARSAHLIIHIAYNVVIKDMNILCIDIV